MKELLEQIEKITNGENVISSEQMQQVIDLPYIYAENCGASGTGLGTLYSIRLMDENGEDTGEEIIELIEKM
jgi:hypothetical protein